MNATGKGQQPGPAAGLLTGCQDYATAVRNAEEMIHAQAGTATQVATCQAGM